MKTNIPYNSFSKIILRTPLFPLNIIAEILNDKNEIFSKLRNFFHTSIVEEAIFLASPDLHLELKKYFEAKPAPNDAKDKLQFALIKYLLRMSGRPTPFGLFSGFSVGSLGSDTDVFLNDKEKHERHTRLDMNYMCSLAHDLANKPEIKEKLHFFPNNSIYPVGKTLRYVEYNYYNSKRRHHLVSVDSNPHLEKIINTASKGALLKDLRSTLNIEGVSDKERNEYTNEIIESQLLLSELEPALTGPGFLVQLIDVLDRINYKGEILSILSSVLGMIKEIDKKGIGQKVTGYREITEKLNLINTGIDKNFLFQVDLKISAKRCILDRTVISDTLKGISVMKRLTRNAGNPRLSEFKTRFFERYGEQEVLLPEALDADLGIGYGNSKSEGDISPLIDDLVFPLKKTAINISWDAIQSFYLQKYHQALSDGCYEVAITDKDIEGFNCDWDDFPDTFAALVRIIKNEDRHEIILDKVGGSGAANLIGRFCHADDKLHKMAREITQKERSYHKDAILAEIIHLPQSRTGNILQRPSIRDYEIPYLGISSVSESKQIIADDLYVSVRNDRVFLRSKRLNEWIIPRLSTAHNYSYDALAVYQFLCDLQMQDMVSSISFDWGAHSGEYCFLPRARYKNIILSLATWNIEKKDVKELLEVFDDSILLNTIDKWRNIKKIPPRVMLCESDNELLIDFRSIVSIRMFLSMIKNRAGFQIKEFLFDENNSIVNSRAGGFANEFILTFYKDI